MLYDQEIKRERDYTNISHLFPEDETDLAEKSKSKEKKAALPGNNRRSRGDISYFCYYKYNRGGPQLTQRISSSPKTSSSKTS